MTFTSPNQIFLPSHPLEIFGEVSEDDTAKILLFGHSNFNSAMRYLYMKNFDSELVENWYRYRLFLEF